MIEEIAEIKKDKDAVILAHNYQLPEIQDIADFVGDSLDLARRGAETDHSMIVFCGVKFMAESARILATDKKILMPVKDAGCPMADMADGAGLEKIKKEHPDAAVVSYVNTTAETKAHSDYCCTSANAIKVVEAIPNDKIIFVPDQNLASWVSRNTKKTIIPYPGYCYVHKKIKLEELLKIKNKHPEAETLIHPEADPVVADQADHVLSTGGMVKHVKRSHAMTFIIGTEEGLIYRLKKENPDKEFYTAGEGLICEDMKKTRLPDLLRSLKEESYEITIADDIMNKARRALERMLEIGRSDGGNRKSQ